MVQCDAVVSVGGTEQLATGVADGVSLQFLSPNLPGDPGITLTSCSTTRQGLTQQCTFQLIDGTNRTVNFAMSLTDSASQSEKTVTDSVLLPFSVETIGSVPQIPLLFAASASDRQDLRGLQITTFDPKTYPLGIIKNFVVVGPSVYAAAGSYIYLIEGGRAQLYAGSSIYANRNSVANRLGTGFGSDIHIFARPNALTGRPELLVAGKNLNRILLISPDGAVSYLTRNSMQGGFSGDGGPVSEAAVNAPTLIVGDSRNNIYFFDSGNLRIRRIDSKGMISTVAVLRSQNIVGLAVMPDGSVYYAEKQQVFKIPPGGKPEVYVNSSGAVGSSGDGGPAIDATLNVPNGLFAGSDGFLYIADTLNGSVRKVSPSSLITTARHFSKVSPGQVVVLNTGEMYVSGAGTDILEDVDAKGNLTTIVGGSASGASSTSGGSVPVDANTQIGSPTGLALVQDRSTGSSTLYFADVLNLKIRKLVRSADGTTYLSDVASHLERPGGIAIASDGSIYFAEIYANRVRRVDPSGVISTVAGTTGAYGYRIEDEGALATTALLYHPQDLSFGPDGSLFIADAGNHRVRKIDPQGKIWTVAGTGSNTSVDDNCPATLAGITPHAVTAAPDGSFFIADNSMSVGLVRRVDPQGKITTLAGQGSLMSFPDGTPAKEISLAHVGKIVLGSGGKLYLTNGEQILMLSPSNGDYLAYVYAGAATSTVCGSGTLAGKASASAIDSMLKASLTHVCLSAPVYLAVSSSCQGAPGDTETLYFSQNYFMFRTDGFQSDSANGNIVRIEQPCSP